MYMNGNPNKEKKNQVENTTKPFYSNIISNFLIKDIQTPRAVSIIITSFKTLRTLSHNHSTFSQLTVIIN